MMVQQNGWSSLFLIPFVLLSGELFKFLEFAKLFPYVYLNLLSIGVASAVGQLFLFNMVKFTDFAKACGHSFFFSRCQNLGLYLCPSSPPHVNSLPCLDL